MTDIKTHNAHSRRNDFKYILPLQTRWADNDIYGHINNVAYYSYFDTIVNEFLISTGVLDIHQGDIIGLVVENGCQYFAPLAFPQKLDGALKISHIGNSSVKYELGIFQHDLEAPAAEGHFIHVYVDRTTRKPVPLPDNFRNALTRILST